MADASQATSLRSKDNNALLDAIDQLRSYGVHRYIPLPQLIVTGDQSAGKSSVLEAVSGVRFPIKDSLCTRFATELILRRGTHESLKITITPGQGRSPDEAASLSRFQPSKASPQLSDLPQLIEDVKEALGISQDKAAFCNDVLKIEITGPLQPDLTLVDLPGLIHAKSEKTSENDVTLVSNLVQQYMSSSRSIILAVVSAKNDYANQVITTRARKADPNGSRTLGIITKPDALDAGSDSERMYADLIRNGEAGDFKLGWHALRNRDYTTRNNTDAERDAVEADFFSKGIWLNLPASCVGIHTLKPRLSQILENQIIAELPRLIQDVEDGIAECSKVIARLGTARGTTKEQRRYLLNISDSFRGIIAGAAGGNYTDPFFGSNETFNLRKRLRASIQSMLLEFTRDMHFKGHTTHIVDKVTGDQSFGGRPKIARSDFVKTASRLMRNSRGCELPGTFNPSIIGEMFFEQAQPWKELSDSHSQKILSAVWTCMELALVHVSDESIRLKIQYHIIEPAMLKCTLAMKEKLTELLRPSRGGHPITYNHYFTETVQQIRSARSQEQALAHIKRLDGRDCIDSPSLQLALKEMASETQKNMDLYSVSEAVECMEAFYKVALKMFIDNFAILAVEYCVLEKLADFFTPQTVLDLDDDTVEEIAGETSQTRVERTRALAKLESLDAGLQVLRRIQRQKPTKVSNPFEKAERLEINGSGYAPIAEPVGHAPISSWKFEALEKQKTLTHIRTSLPTAGDGKQTEQITAESNGFTMGTSHKPVFGLGSFEKLPGSASGSVASTAFSKMLVNPSTILGHEPSHDGIIARNDPKSDKASAKRGLAQDENAPPLNIPAAKKNKVG
ncbi:MAG: hypothetical protein M1828_004893 [Chrysothrix sp. TS-e1954]|nr:MAG: hypothetical protein M1828_004893 [Chrysothrix sp. TS-e1954]